MAAFPTTNQEHFPHGEDLSKTVQYLMETYREPLLKFIRDVALRRLHKDIRPDPDDVLQDMLMSVCTGSSVIKYDGEKRLRSLLCRIAQNHVNANARREKSRPEKERLVNCPDPVDQPYDDEMEDEYANFNQEWALLLFEKACREVVESYRKGDNAEAAVALSNHLYQDKVPNEFYESLSDELNKSPGSLKQLKHRMLVSMRVKILAEIRQTTPDVDDELQFLLRAMQR